MNSMVSKGVGKTHWIKIFINFKSSNMENMGLVIVGTKIPVSYYMVNVRGKY